MKIVSVQTYVLESFIPFPDFNAVKRALCYIESGLPAETLQALRPVAGVLSGGLSRIVRTALVEEGLGSSYLERKMSVMKRAFNKGEVRQELDYNGSAGLHDAKIQIYKTLDPAGPYALHFSVSRHPFHTTSKIDEAEARLAQDLGIERGLWKIESRFEISPSGNKFEFDCNEIAARLRRAGMSDLTATQIIDPVIGGVSRDEYLKGPGKASLPWPGASVDLAIIEETVEDFLRTGYELDERTWHSGANVISGKLKGRANPAFVITVNPPVRDLETRGNFPIFRPETKARMRAAATRLIDTFK